jgi:hypothetical protein
MYIYTHIFIYIGMPVSSLSITVTGAFSAADFYRNPMFYAWSTCPKIIAGIYICALYTYKYIYLYIHD